MIVKPVAKLLVRKPTRYFKIQNNIFAFQYHFDSASRHPVFGILFWGTIRRTSERVETHCYLLEMD